MENITVAKLKMVLLRLDPLDHQALSLCLVLWISVIDLQIWGGRSTWPILLKNLQKLLYSRKKKTAR